MYDNAYNRIILLRVLGCFTTDWNIHYGHHSPSCSFIDEISKEQQLFCGCLPFTITSKIEVQPSATEVWDWMGFKTEMACHFGTKLFGLTTSFFSLLVQLWPVLPRQPNLPRKTLNVFPLGFKRLHLDTFMAPIKSVFFWKWRAKVHLPKQIVVFLVLLLFSRIYQLIESYI